MKFFALKKLKAPVSFLIFGIFLIYLFLPKPEIFDLDYSKSFYDSKGELLKISLSEKDNYRVFVNLDEVNPDYIKAILLYEDRFFYYHLGVNPFSLARSFWQSFVVGDRIYGASTISMQVARMKFDIRSNKILGKLKQIFYAIKIERHYTKKEILTAYINLLPFGGNIYGVETASRVYFKKSSKNINLLEALNLAIIPQNPTKRAPKAYELADLEKNKLLKFENKEILQAQKNLLQKWQTKYGKDSSLKNFIGLNLAVGTRSDLPNFAPHFVNFMQDLDLSNFNYKIYTSLDLNLQQKAEIIISDYIKEKSKYGIKNAVALIVDSKTLEVKALVGSANFNDVEISGQVDGTSALRSPGSTLKPFAYALALEQGLIHPASMLEDVPSFYGAYQPMNFDFKYRGLLSATQSLLYSRNLPAVYLASRIDNPDLYNFLQLADSNLKQDADYYGMGLVLGGVDLSMRKLVELYAIIANDGFYGQLNYFKNSQANFTKRLLSPEAAFLIFTMLSENPHNYSYTNFKGKLAWKTGTSYAFRDAWSIGLAGDYIVGVWLGNFDSSSNKNLVGASVAVPLWLKLSNYLLSSGIAKELKKPTGALKIRKVEICAATGDLPSRYCPKTKKTWIIDGVSPLKVEEVFRKVKIDKKTNLRLCDYEIADKSTYREELFEFWSLDILNLYKKAGVVTKQAPAYKTTCVEYEDEKSDLKIILPNAKTRVALDLKSGFAKVLFKGRARDSQKFYWFLNDKFIGETKEEEVLVYKTDKVGKFQVKMLDDLARSRKTWLFIETIDSRL